MLTMGECALVGAIAEARAYGLSMSWPLANIGRTGPLWQLAQLGAPRPLLWAWNTDWNHWDGVAEAYHALVAEGAKARPEQRQRLAASFAAAQRHAAQMRAMARAWVPTPGPVERPAANLGLIIPFPQRRA